MIFIHAKGFPVYPDAGGLSTAKEKIELVQKVCHRDTIKLGQSLYLLLFNALLNLPR